MQILNKFFGWLFFKQELNKKYYIDEKLLCSGIFLLSIGIVMVYSASIAYANNLSTGSSYYYLTHHLIFITLGFIASIIVFSINTDFWYKNIHSIKWIMVLLLIAVLFPHIGKMVNGSRRWIGVMGISFQPSEFTKIFVPMYVSYYLVQKKKLNKFFIDFFPLLLIIILIAVLLLKEPDMGSVIIISLIVLSLLIIARSNLLVILGIFLSIVLAIALLISLEPYRIRRVAGYLNPWEDVFGKGYQLTHSLLAVGHGGWFGVGLGNSIEKLFYLPEAHTDFILSIIIEETGMVGGMVILFLFWVIFYRGIVIISRESMYLKRNFQGYLSSGISFWFIIQAFFNILVTIGLLPTKGLTLPFISFGGSSMLVSCIALAILLKIDRENKIILNKV